MGFLASNHELTADNLVGVRGERLLFEKLSFKLNNGSVLYLARCEWLWQNNAVTHDLWAYLSHMKAISIGVVKTSMHLPKNITNMCCTLAIFQE